MVRLSLALALLLFAGSVRGETERILIPIYFDWVVWGGYGSQWVAESAVYNGGPEAIQFFPRKPCTPPIPPPTFCSGPSSLASGATSDLTGLRGTQDVPGPGMIFNVIGDGDQVAVSVRIRDVSLGTEQLGTQIPAIHERFALTGAANLLDIPGDSRYRIHLRLYDFDGRPEGRFRVRVYTGRSPLIETEMITRGYTSYPLIEIDKPGYAEAELINIPEGTHRIEIVPMTEGMRYWAFATITNRKTQLVTLATP